MIVDNKCSADLHHHLETTPDKPWQDNDPYDPSIIYSRDPIEPLTFYEIRGELDNKMDERNPRHILKVGLPETPGSTYDGAANAYPGRIPYNNHQHNAHNCDPGDVVTGNFARTGPPHAFNYRYPHTSSNDRTDNTRTHVPHPGSVYPAGLPNRGSPSGGASQRPSNSQPRGAGHAVRRDWVDGDEPGTLIDPELENLTQPHMVITQPRYPRFADEETRMATFAAWRNPFPSVVLLVLSGFFFLGGRDSVQCFHCGVILHSWEESDIPDEEHKKHSPNCVFMRLKARGAQGGPPANYQQAGQTRNYASDSQHLEPAPRRQQQQQQQQQKEIMKTVAGLGHSMDVVEKAMERLRLSGRENVDTSMLVDAVFDVEDNEDLEEGAGESEEAGACANSPVESRPERQEKQDPPTRPEVTADHAQNTAQANQETTSILEKAKQLEKENEDLRKQTTCRVCFERPATEVFLPCGHLACCEECSGRLSECPYCRKKILRTVHVFLP